MQIEIRRWKPGDEESLALNANSFNIWKNVRNRMPFPYTIDDARNWIGQNQYMDPVTHFAIVVDGVAAGSVGFELKDDIYIKNAEVGYWLGEKYWGRGISTYALEWIVKYIFSEFAVHRIYATVFINNLASRRVLEKAGFILEAVHQQAVFKEGKFIDECIYKMLNEEFHDPDAVSGD
jgi:RimJ/RimL family protein N-acetyltransferase